MTPTQVMRLAFPQFFLLEDELPEVVKEFGTRNDG